MAKPPPSRHVLKKVMDWESIELGDRVIGGLVSLSCEPARESQVFLLPFSFEEVRKEGGLPHSAVIRYPNGSQPPVAEFANPGNSGPRGNTCPDLFAVESGDPSTSVLSESALRVALWSLALCLIRSVGGMTDEQLGRFFRIRKKGVGAWDIHGITAAYPAVRPLSPWLQRALSRDPTKWFTSAKESFRAWKTLVLRHPAIDLLPWGEIVCRRRWWYPGTSRTRRFPGKVSLSPEGRYFATCFRGLVTVFEIVPCIPRRGPFFRVVVKHRLAPSGGASLTWRRNGTHGRSTLRAYSEDGGTWSLTLLGRERVQRGLAQCTSIDECGQRWTSGSGLPTFSARRTALRDPYQRPWCRIEGSFATDRCRYRFGPFDYERVDNRFDSHLSVDPLHNPRLWALSLRERNFVRGEDGNGEEVTIGGSLLLIDKTTGLSTVDGTVYDRVIATPHYLVAVARNQLRVFT